MPAATPTAKQRLPDQHQQRARLCARRCSDDGRVVYSRWEYSDKDQNRVQSLWTTNQDGTGTAVLWGNQSVWPDHLAEPRPIPGSGRVMFTGVGHHDWFNGSIGIIDPRQGSNFPHGLTRRHLGPALGGGRAILPATGANRRNITPRDVTRDTWARIRFRRRIFWFPPGARMTNSAST